MTQRIARTGLTIHAGAVLTARNPALFSFFERRYDAIRNLTTGHQS
jgi:hypothetical protein